MNMPVYLPKTRASWTVEAVTITAKAYKTKREFKLANKPAYTAALRHGIIDELFDNKYSAWTIDKAIEVAQGYTTRADLKRECQYAYKILLKAGMLDSLLAPQRRAHTEQSLAAEAIKYESRADWSRNDASAYERCLDRFPHILAKYLPVVSTFNTREMVYIWKVKELDNIYKIGITSKSLASTRLDSVAAAASLTVELSSIVETASYYAAVKLEAKLKSIGVTHNFNEKFNGYTEFRRFSEEDLAQAESLLWEAKWQNRFIRLAGEIASWSKELTKVGAVLVANTNRFVSEGYNGEDPNGVTHAEINALQNARYDGKMTMFVTRAPCSHCADAIVQDGRVTKLVVRLSDNSGKWEKSVEAGIAALVASGVEVTHI